MDRREFSKLVGMGVIGATHASGLDAAAQERRPAVQVAARNRKEWAREHFRGFENILMPSFTPDLSALDEDGIRLDVRQSAAHGFFSTFPAGMGLRPEEARRFFEIVVDEGKRANILVAAPVFGPPDQVMNIVKGAEQAGASHLFVGFPRTAKTQDELYAYVKSIADNTNLGIILWATDDGEFKHLHPSNVPFEALDKAANLPNVVALKIMATLDPVAVSEIYERLGKRMLVGAVGLNLAPLLVKNYGMQWSGAWTVEALQSPEKRYAVDFFNLLLKGQHAQAMKVYWQMYPAYQTLYAIMAPLLQKGVHAAAVLKYHQWCVGGNGGAWRPQGQPEAYTVRDDWKQAIRKAYRDIGIQPREGGEEFTIGRVNYGKRRGTPTASTRG